MKCATGWLMMEQTLFDDGKENCEREPKEMSKMSEKMTADDSRKWDMLTRTQN